MDGIHMFFGKAEGYEKYRPSYPRALIDYYYRELGISSDSIIADVGAGTGLMSRLLLEKGSRVLCVEPNQDMAAVARERLKDYSRWEWVAATAENTRLPERSVDFITAAQAFHWFSQAKFKEECRRILRPGGKVALVWNNRNEDDSLTKESYLICKRICPEFRGFSGGKETPGDYRSFFRDGTYETRAFPNDLIMNEEQYLGRYLSASYAPKKGECGYEEFIKSLTGVFDAHQQDGYVKWRNTTFSSVGEV